MDYIVATKPITTNPMIILIIVAKPLSPKNPFTIYATIPPINKAAIPFIFFT